jgi:ethanolamine utilization protein EutQ (cupin superfamily)
MPVEETILRYQVMKEMDKGSAFSMCWVTYNAKKGTGGELKSVVNWCKVKQELKADTEAPANVTTKNRPLYDPDHWNHGTVNIMNPNNYGQHITKVHWALITIFNGKRVIN